MRVVGSRGGGSFGWSRGPAPSAEALWVKACEHFSVPGPCRRSWPLAGSRQGSRGWPWPPARFSQEPLAFQTGLLWLKELLSLSSSVLVRGEDGVNCPEVSPELKARCPAKQPGRLLLMYKSLQCPSAQQNVARPSQRSPLFPRVVCWDRRCSGEHGTAQRSCLPRGPCSALGLP